MPEVAGLTKCPVCGTEGQEVRVNKKRKLYIYCDHGCAMRFNSQQSRDWLAKLSAGKVVREGNFAIFPLKTANQNEQLIEKPQEKGDIENDRRGDTVDGRADAGLAANSGIQPVQQPSGRGWLADWFADDDDE